jgi:ribosomal protein S18 acetylase RimI-like enzyme
MNSFQNLLKLNGYPLKKTGDIISQGFHDDPLNSYLIPDENDRRKYYPYVYMGYLCYCLEYGEVYSTSSALEGFAFWLPSKVAHLTPERVKQCGADPFLLRIGWDYLKRFEINDQVIETHQQLIGEPHMYLMILCVDPKFQGKGFGKKLLAPMLRRLDDEKMKCFLDTNNQSNVAFYQLFGFEIIKEYEIGDTKVINWAMLRKPIIQG